VTPRGDGSAAGRRSFGARLMRRPSAVAALLFLAALIVACVAAPLIAPYGPGQQDLTAVLQGPSGAHWLGTDTLGRDVLSRLIYGGRTSLLAIVEAVAVVVLVGVPFGLIAGYVGGWTDRLLSRMAEALMAIPAVIIVLVVLAVLPQDETAAMLTFGLLGAPSLLRVTRSATLKVREELYITAARVSGLSHFRIIVRHVLPRVRGAVIVQASIFAAFALIFETGIAYLGLTASPTTPTWGGMVAEASTVLQQTSWLLVPSGVLIALTILALGLLGDSIRDVAVMDDASPRRTAGELEDFDALIHTPPPAALNGADSGALLQVRDLTVATVDGGRGTRLVDSVSLDVRAGETVGMVGESGCGKSITAAALLRLLPEKVRAVSGGVYWEGEEILGLPERAFDRLRGSTLAYVSQEPQASIDPTFTIGGLLAEVVRSHERLSRRAAKERALELLRMVEMPDPEQVARGHAHELSGGMAQRVALAMALAGRPRVLVADEPTTALDVTVQAEILALLKRVQAATGMAILLITHDLGVVADICDRIYVMYAGQVVEDCATQELFDRPLHPYTAGLLASHPSLARHGEVLPTMAGQVPPPGSWPRGCRFAARCRFATPECEAAPVASREPERGHASRCIRVEQVFAAVES
jgi:oligopeptide/dipeptide ABC transporter ATP-binding protein